MYFATLTEVPIIKGLIANGMGKGPALAVNGEVKISGKTPGAEKLIQILNESQKP